MATPNLVPRASSLLVRFKCREKKPWGRGWATPSTSCLISDSFSLLPNWQIFGFFSIVGWPYNDPPQVRHDKSSMVFLYYPTRGDFIMATPSTAWQIFDRFSLLPNSGWPYNDHPKYGMTNLRWFFSIAQLLYYGHPKYGMTNLRLFFTIGQSRSQGLLPFWYEGFFPI